MQHPSWIQNTPQPIHNRPLHKSFVVSTPQHVVNQPLRVANQPVFTQPPKQEQFMYKSTIQPPSFAMNCGGGVGLGRLESMGRVVR